jgi:hypothetical protein
MARASTRRQDAAWTQRYEHGIPVPGSGATGTTVQLGPDETDRLTGSNLTQMSRSGGSGHCVGQDMADSAG